MSELEPEPDWQFVRARVRKASRLTRHPEARDELRAVLGELAPDLGAPIEQCPACGVLGTRERLREHDCRAR
jgi:hypothetical protein